LREVYDLSFRAKVSFDSTFMYEAVESRRVDVITAFSSDGRISAYDLVVLDDPRHAFPPYDALLLLSPRVASDARVVGALSPLVGAMSVERMRQANLMVDRDQDKKTPAEAAQWLWR
jgi:osmoprotectant transport system permease protein